MSQEQGPTLSPAQIEQITNAFATRGVNPVCPTCGKRGFEIASYGLEAGYEMPPTTPRLGGDSFPTVVTICRNCGYVRSHNLAAPGIHPSQQ